MSLCYFFFEGYCQGDCRDDRCNCPCRGSKIKQAQQFDSWLIIDDSPDTLNVTSLTINIDQIIKSHISGHQDHINISIKLPLLCKHCKKGVCCGQQTVFKRL